MIFLHKNGLVHALNRRGERISGFPLDLKGQTDNQFFIQRGGTAETTIFTALTNDGELIEFNLKGKFLKRQQLFKTTANDKFDLVISNNKKNFIIVRSDDEKITMLNSEGEEQFSHLFFTPEFTTKYYNFGVENEVIIITDVQKNLTYLYAQDGRILHSLPLETGEDISMLYYNSQGAYKLYRTFGNKLSVLNLKR